MPNDFKTIPFYPNYSVSSDGRVRSDKKGKILSQVDNGKGYKVVKLYNEDRPQGRLCLIHRLVLSTFDPNDGHFDVNHIDGIKDHNELSNLEWVTHSENLVHTHKVGLFHHKLTNEQVLLIREMAATKEHTHREIYT